MRNIYHFQRAPWTSTRTFLCCRTSAQCAPAKNTLSRLTKTKLWFLSWRYASRVTHEESLWGISEPYTNPVTQLKEFIHESSLSEDNNLFLPGKDAQVASKRFFVQVCNEKRITVHKGVVDLLQLPRLNLPEVAFLGQSNVGKSSLLRAVFNDDASLRISVSKKPGHTKTLRFYQVGQKFTLVDMPGYGDRMPEYFVASVEQYLKSRRQLVKVFLLIDGILGVQSSDEIAFEMMEEFSKPYAIVMTKIDKITPSTAIKNLMYLRKRMDRNMHCCFPQPFLASSINGWGVPVLQAFVTHITGTS